jgi:hypothetical protein
MTTAESAAARLAARIGASELRGLDGGKYQLAVSDLKPVRPRAGWMYLAVAIRGANGEASRTPLMMGIVSGGGRGAMPWVEGRLYPSVEFADGTMLDARATGLEAAFIDLIGTLIPPGGHLMIEYESPGQNDTHAELLLRVPPAATYLGALMFRAGFRGHFKDWYISEGGHEGPRKLQANKSPTPEAARDAMRANLAELREFVKRPLPQDPEDRAIVARAKARARDLLKDFDRPRPGSRSGAHRSKARMRR